MLVCGLAVAGAGLSGRPAAGSHRSGENLNNYTLWGCLGRRRKSCGARLKTQ